MRKYIYFKCTMQIFSFFCPRAMHFSPAIANFTDYMEQARTASDKKSNPPKAGLPAREGFVLFVQ